MKTVLFVDDEKTLLESVRSGFLNNSETQLLTAENGPRGAGRIRQEQCGPDRDRLENAGHGRLRTSGPPERRILENPGGCDECLRDLRNRRQAEGSRDNGYPGQAARLRQDAENRRGFPSQRSPFGKRVRNIPVEFSSAHRNGRKDMPVGSGVRRERKRFFLSGRGHPCSTRCTSA